MRIFLTLFILLFLNTAYCCSCEPLGKIDDQQYNKYDLIFIGKVVSIKKKLGMKEVAFESQTKFKGVHSSSKIIIMTSAYESECGILPKIGDEWLVFSYFDKDRFKTNLCTRTKSMNKKAWNYNKEELQQDIEYLNQKLRG